MQAQHVTRDEHGRAQAATTADTQLPAAATGGTRKTARKRIDLLLVELGLAPTRSKAQALVLAGEVVADDQAIDKAGTLVREDAQIRLKGRAVLGYVSRGGLKLRGALDHFHALEVKGRAAVDVGASTGGFTDCLLQAGVASVIAIDVGYGQLAWRIAQDPRVTVMDRTNIRDLPPGGLPHPADLAVIDCSFISLTQVLTPLVELLARPADIVALIKPQFELGPGRVGKGGIVRADEDRTEALERVMSHARALGLGVVDHCESPISGREGNREWLAWFQLPPAALSGQQELR